MSIFCFDLVINDTATTDIYTLSLHDALPISHGVRAPMIEAELWKAEIRALSRELGLPTWDKPSFAAQRTDLDRKSTRLNSSHQIISYAVFCLKKKRQTPRRDRA